MISMRQFGYRRYNFFAAGSPSSSFGGVLLGIMATAQLARDQFRHEKCRTVISPIASIAALHVSLPKRHHASAFLY